MKTLTSNSSSLTLNTYGDREPYFDRVRELGVADCLEIIDDFVPDQRVEDYFLAADLVVLPYVSATQSGVVQIAYNYDKPVVTTEVGGLPEVVLDGETADTCYQMGLALSSLDRLDDAERYLKKAAEASPDDPRIHYQLGVVLDRLGRSVDAVDFYRRADKLHARS